MVCDRATVRLRDGTRICSSVLLARHLFAFAICDSALPFLIACSLSSLLAFPDPLLVGFGDQIRCLKKKFSRIDKSIR
jgi:hypothetical protein